MRAFNMSSVGGRTSKPSRRKLDRAARAHGFRDAKAWSTAIMAQRFRELIAAQAANPQMNGWIEPTQEAA
jgi:hypothetical protein